MWPHHEPQDAKWWTEHKRSLKLAELLCPSVQTSLWTTAEVNVCLHQTDSEASDHFVLRREGTDQTDVDFQEVEVRADPTHRPQTGLCRVQSSSELLTVTRAHAGDWAVILSSDLITTQKKEVKHFLIKAAAEISPEGNKSATYQSLGQLQN